ncbi:MULTISPECIES: bacteriocin [Chryseobacterium]|jgi:bacteriocin-like protein|uniref:bacteriocin n=1 Tax=Chryseobacterium TaxID=59732 RepID=UPI000F501516|nr:MULTISPECIES: bacteriocin [Chryseobacterium]MBP1166465.1 bacteriocin-like protein [Chryseobacterium sp. PvR013]MDR4891658.1 bacteriocin [Chryseobacterium sp. CFS7]
MKKSNIQKRKLTKNELKQINGGRGTLCPGTCFCNIDGEMTIGACDTKGRCC